MSELVRREDVERVMTEAFDALEKRVARSRHARDGHMEEKWCSRLAEVGALRKQLRALPAIGNCATCAEWDSGYWCEGHNFPADPAQSCAAWRARQ